MPNFEWVFKNESDTEKVYEIKNSSEYVRVCTPAVNKQLNERYEILKHGLRAGYFLIKDVHQQKNYKSGADENVSRFSYKEKFDKKFVDMGLSIKLQPLFNFVSACLNDDKLRYKKNPTGLISKIIQIQSCELVDSEYNGQISKVNQVKWLTLNDQNTIEYNSDDEEIPEDNDSEERESDEDFNEGDADESIDFEKNDESEPLELDENEPFEFDEMAPEEQDEREPREDDEMAPEELDENEPFDYDENEPHELDENDIEEFFDKGEKD
ncbi:MAG TPA: hypothetical protein VIK55_15515 [Paludibacter sp.]